MSLDTIALLDIHVCINNPCWQISRIITILYKYYIVTSDTLKDSWICFFVASFNIIGASWGSKKKRLSYRKKYIEEFVRENTFLAARPPCVIFCRFFVYSLPFFYSNFIKKNKFCSVKWWSIGPARQCLRPWMTVALCFQRLY